MKGSMILRTSCGERDRVSDGGEVSVVNKVPFSSALRFFERSMDGWGRENKP